MPTKRAVLTRRDPRDLTRVVLPKTHEERVALDNLVKPLGYKVENYDNSLDGGNVRLVGHIIAPDPTHFADHGVHLFSPGGSRL